MERNYFKRIASAFLSVMLVLTSVSIAPAAQVSDTVVFVDFKDTTHEHEKTELGKCYKEDPKITEYFEGDEEHPRALKQYVSNISYGQLNVQNIIPQYDSENNKIEPYVLSNDVSYYGDRTVGTSGPALGDTRMVKEISELLAKDSRFPKDAIVDYDGDGCVDNLMIVTACEKGNSNSQMYGHKSTYAGTDEINSKKIGSYTVIPEGLAYFGLSETGVVIHEFMHTLGYPDLYVNTNVSGVVPVGQWDIMAMECKFIQYPLAYFRSAYSGWFDIPTVTESKKNCSIYAASSTTFDTRNNQAVILRTDYSSNEFFVVEYRKQKAKYDVASYDDKSYEGKIYGSGLIIYRINASLIGGNMYGPPYKAYVFRPGDSILNGYEKADYTNLDKSFLSAESGRTSYGTHDKNAGIADNAITYSDGTNSGIVIENVGSASGDTITFDISFADDGQEGRWITESTDTLGLSLSDIETYTDSEQNKYFIANIGDGYGYATNDTVLFKYSDGAWSKITDGPKAVKDGKSIVTYNGDVYISYLDTNFYARVDKWNGSSWQNIYKTSGYSDNVSLVAGSEGIYFSYTSQDNSNIYAYKYDGNTLKNLSDNILAGAVSSMPANAAISVDADENIFVEYRDTANNSNIYIKKYNQIDNSWNAVLNGSIQANEVVLSNNNGKLYLFKKGTAFDTVKDSYLYSLDYANSAKEWTQVGTNSITDKGVNNASLCFDGDNVYVGTTASDNITFVSGLVDGEWQQLGTNVSIQDISGLNISYGNSKIYATYLDSDTGKAVVRSYEVKSADKPEQPVEVPITEVQLGREALDMYEGDTFKLTATVLPVNTTDSKDISWSSNNEAVATVSEDGTVTAKSVGTAVITATSTNGKTASCTVTVEKKLIPITEVSLSESAVGIIEGNTHKLTATVLPENTTDSKSVSWSSNNEAVATVSEDGTITAKSAGTAVITATSTNGKTAGCTVTVSKKEIPIVDVALNRTSATITEGDILNLTATVLPENTTESKNIGWSSSNNDIATVDSTGKVTAKQAGTVVITATSSNGKTASCTITVEKKEIPITEVVLNKTSAAVDEGETIKLIATVYPENTTNGKSIKWSSNNNTVVTVDLMGNVTAKKAGTAIITATSENGVSASCTITVNKRDTYTGLRDVNGKLTYFNNGNVDTTYTGLVDYEDSTYYVRNGVVDITYTGFADYEDDRYYISEGVVDTEYTGLVQDGDDWLYVENGKVNSDYTGLTYYNDVWFYITNGKINWGYTGLVYYNDIWFYVSGGMIDWNYVGLVYYNDVWFYVSGGMIGWDYTGLAYFADTWFYISNGMLDWNYLGLTYYNDMWFVISGGTINWSYMGLVYYNDIWFYVSGGTINWDYEGLIYYRDTWFYVSGGCVDWTTAVIEYNGNKFYIQDGMVDWNFSGTIDYKGYTYHIVGGMVV